MSCQEPNEKVGETEDVLSVFDGGLIRISCCVFRKTHLSSATRVAQKLKPKKLQEWPNTSRRTWSRLEKEQEKGRFYFRSKTGNDIWSAAPPPRTPHFPPLVVKSSGILHKSWNAETSNVDVKV